MEQIDLLVLIFLLLGFLIGVFKGFIKQMLSVICLIAGIVVAKAFAPIIAGMFDNDYSRIAYGVSFAIIVLGIIIGGVVIGKIIKSLLVSADLGWINRVLGGILGSFKYLIIIGVVISLLEIFGADKKLLPHDITTKSYFYGLSKKSLSVLMPFYEQVSDITNDLIDKSGLKE